MLRLRIAALYIASVVGSLACGQDAVEPTSTLPPLWQRAPQPMEIRLKESFFKHHAATLKHYASLITDARKSTVRVLQDNRQVALGTALTESGFVATKFSELDETKPIKCTTWDGQTIPAKLTDTSDDWDLALLKLDSELTPISVSKSGVPPLGSFLASVDTGSKPFSIGTVSVLPRALLRGFLGILMEETNDESGVRVVQVIRHSAASDAGLKVGDIVTAVDKATVTHLNQLKLLIGDRRPGDTITLSVTRDENELEMEATLGERSSDSANSRTGNRAVGIPLSKRKTGFPRVLQHDLFVRPHQCGGPIVDLDGQVVGINIARYDRVTSYAIPADQIALLLDTDDEGHIRFTRPVATIQSDLTAAEAAVKKSMAELSENMQRVKQLQSELDRQRKQDE